MVGDWTGQAVDVAVVGAGAAGVGAARALQAIRPDLSILVLEASNRIGGRALTVEAAGTGDPVDLGCGWLHGARSNAWTRIAGELGLAVDRTPAPWNADRDRNLGLSDADQKQANADLRAYFERLDARDPAAPDAALSTALDPASRWNGLIGAIGTYINGAELDRASILDYERYEPGEGPDWRVREGYGTLVGRYGAPLPVSFGTVVSEIQHGDTPMRLLTSRGTLRAQTVIVTVSTDLLAREVVRFVPPLPAKLEAAANLPLGVCNKLFLGVTDADDLPVEGNVFGSAHRVATANYAIRPFGRALIEAYLGGENARTLEREGPEAALAFAAEELVAHFGSAFRKRLSLAACSAWASNPHALGSYSYARPGAADARAALAEPVDDRLFFAGEACPPAKFSTAHGAYESGVTAAQQVPAWLQAG